MPYANNNSADHPAHLRSLISTFFVPCLDSICILALSKVSRLYLVSIAEQAGLSLTWSKIPEDTFSHDVAHIRKIAILAKYWKGLYAFFWSDRFSCFLLNCFTAQSILDQLTWPYNSWAGLDLLFEPAHEIMVLFILCKLHTVYRVLSLQPPLIPIFFCPGL